MAPKSTLILETIDKGSQNAVNFGKKVFGAWKDLATPLNQTLEIFGKVQAAGEAAMAAIGEGAEAAQVTESFQRMNEEIFKTPDLLNQMREAARGTIDDTTLMAGVMTLTAGATDELAKQYAEMAPQLTEMAKAANKLNPTLGDTAFLYESISTGIKRQSPLILDNLGIVVKAEDAYVKYAASMGKTAAELTGVEKQMAFTKAAMEGGAKLIEQAGGNVDSMGDSLARLETNLENVRSSFLAAFATEVTGNIDDVNAGFGDMTQSAEDLGEAMGAIAVNVIPVLVGAVEKVSAAFALMAQDINFQQQLDDLKAVGAITEEIAIEIADQYSWGEAGAAAAQKVLDSYAREWQGGLDSLVRRSGDQSDFMLRWAEAQSAGAREAGQMLVAEVAEGMEGGVDAAYRLAAAQDAAGDLDIGVTPEQVQLAEDTREAAKKAGEDLATATYDAYMGYLEEKSVRGGDFFSGALEENLFWSDDEYARINGQTTEQAEALQQLQSSYDKAAQTVADYQTGVRGFGEDQETINKNLEQAGEAMAYYQEKMEPLIGITGELVQVNESGWNLEAIYEGLYKEADAAGASAEALALLGVATGQFTEEQAKAALKTAALQEEIRRLGIEIAKEDGLGVDEAIAELDRFVMRLDEGLVANPEVLFEPEFVQGDDVQSALENAMGVTAGQDMGDLIQESMGGDITIAPPVHLVPDVGDVAETVNREIYNEYTNAEVYELEAEIRVKARIADEQAGDFQDEMNRWFNENKDSAISEGWGATVDIPPVQLETELDQEALTAAQEMVRTEYAEMPIEFRTAILEADSEPAQEEIVILLDEHLTPLIADPYEVTVTADVDMAMTELARVKAEIESIPRSVTVTVNAVSNDISQTADDAIDRARERVGA